MAVGKVVVITRGGMDKDSKEIFMAAVPKGWNPILVDMNEGEAKVAKELEDTEYLITTGSGGGVISEKLIQNAKKLKIIQNTGQDTGHLPVKYALGHNIYVANGGGANAIAVAEYTVCAILNCMKRVIQYNQGIREGKWRLPLDRKGQHELYDKTVGIVGFGAIGRRVAHLCYGFGANIIYHERFFVPYALRADMKAKPVGFEELLKTADVVSLHVPSFSTNRKMMGYEQFSMMKPTSYLVNTSRGANVDEGALLRALKEGKIAGAALDVWDPEPPDPKNPLIQMPNIVATPHIAGSSWENIFPAYETVWRGVVMVSEGKEPLNRIRDF